MNVDVYYLKDKIKSNEKFRLIDVRTIDEVMQSGLIKGAEHIQLNNIMSNVGNFRGSDEVIFYCRSGVRSFSAVAALMELGLNNVKNLEGGIISWIRIGEELVN